MRKFQSLSPVGLIESFKAQIHGEEPLVDVEESKGKIVLSYVFPGFYLVDDVRWVDGKEVIFQQVNVGSAGHLTKSGRPLLPSFGRYLQIPAGYNYKVNVKAGAKVVFDDVLVLPSQQMIMDGVEASHVFEYDEEFYGQDLVYPPDLVTVSGPFEIDDYRTILVHVTPLQYNPSKRRLVGYGNITVTVNLTRDRAKKTYKPGSKVDREAFGNLFLNPKRNIEDRLGLKRPSPEVSEEVYGPELLVIYSELLEAAALKLAKWKNRRGINTECVPIESIGNEVSEIKSYIRKRRGEALSKLRYVLLFGDTDTITPETDIPCPMPREYSGNTSDYYYSTKRDPSGPEDYVLPWMSIGRIPARSGEEGVQVVDQIISYERDPPADPNYYRRILLAAYFQDDDLDGREDRGFLKTVERDLRPALTSIGYDVRRIYVSNNPEMEFYNDGTPIPPHVKASVIDLETARQKLIEATSEGQLYIGHRDHGGTDGWGHPPFTVSDLDRVAGNAPTVFYSINCLTGKFDLSAPTESFAEKNLRMKGAAPSLIAATRVSHTWLNNDLIKALFDATFGGVLPTFPAGVASYPVKGSRLGDALNYAKSYLPIGKSGSPEFIKDHLEIYHVVGDPTIELWKDPPRIVNIQAKIQSRIKFNVLDILMSDCPMGSVLTIWSDETLVRKLEPSSPHVTISLEKAGLTVGADALTSDLEKVVVCFWAPGCRYSEVKVKRSWID